MFVNISSQFDLSVQVVTEFLNNQLADAFLQERIASFAVESADLLWRVVGMLLLLPPLVIKSIVVLCWAYDIWRLWVFFCLHFFWVCSTDRRKLCFLADCKRAMSLDLHIKLFLNIITIQCSCKPHLSTIGYIKKFVAFLRQSFFHTFNY